MKMKDVRLYYNESVKRLLLNGYFRKLLSPTLHDLSELNILSDPEKAIIDILGDSIPEIVKNEYVLLKSYLQSNYNNIDLKYPLNFKIDDTTSFFIYSFMRLYQPLRIVETGVANGHSSFLILSALIRNGKGKLYSIDVSSDVGQLVTEELKKNWELIILSKAKEKKLEEIFKKIYPIDVFIHDSNHSYYWQELEYRLSFKYVKSNGFIMSDDVDSSYAFVDFLNLNKLSSLFLYDTRKVFGISQKDNQIRR